MTFGRFAWLLGSAAGGAIFVLALGLARAAKLGDGQAFRGRDLEREELERRLEREAERQELEREAEREELERLDEDLD